jgi:hypothetical protein
MRLRLFSLGYFPSPFTQITNQTCLSSTVDIPKLYYCFMTGHVVYRWELIARQSNERKCLRAES